jgi:hypothetical protein
MLGEVRDATATSDSWFATCGHRIGAEVEVTAPLC